MNDAKNTGVIPPMRERTSFAFSKSARSPNGRPKERVRQSRQDEGLDPSLWGPYADAWTFAPGPS